MSDKLTPIYKEFIEVSLENKKLGYELYKYRRLYENSQRKKTIYKTEMKRCENKLHRIYNACNDNLLKNYLRKI